MSATMTLSPTRTGFDPVTAIAIAATVVGWASAFPAIRAGLHDFGPTELGAIRFGIAAVPAALYLAIVRPALPTLAEAWRFAVGGIIFVAAYTVLLNYGEQTVSAGAASFVINVSPIMVAGLAMVFLKERFSATAWLGTLTSFVGVGIIALGEGEGLQFNTGTLLILGGALCAAVNTIAQKPLFARHHPLTVAAWNMVIGGLVLAPALPSGIEQAFVASPQGLFSAIYMGFVPSLLAYAAWAVTLSRLPAARASNFLYCIPPVATLIGFVWLGELPTTLGVIGGAMALGGVVIVNLKR